MLSETLQTQIPLPGVPLFAANDPTFPPHGEFLGFVAHFQRMQNGISPLESIEYKQFHASQW